MANVTMPNTGIIVVTVPNAYKIADHALSTKIMWARDHGHPYAVRTARFLITS
jgi:hypothetical protein